MINFKHKLIFFLAAQLFFISSYAQKLPEIKWENETHDFGIIGEREGDVHYTFKFKNTGKADVVIKKVNSPCGCTTPKWAKQPVKPGAMGFIEVAFNPLNRAGFFQKNISVIANTTPELHLLTIEGTVKKQEKPLHEEYTHQSGDILMKRYNVFFGTITDKSLVEEDLEFFNPSEKPITLTSLEAPPYVTVKGLPVTMAPQSVAMLKFKFDCDERTTEKKEYGYVFDEIYLITNDEKEPRKKLYAVADVNPYVPPVLDDVTLSRSPKLEFDKGKHNFGEINEGEKVSTTINITNTGKGNLMILDINSTCGCTVSELEKWALKPGQETRLKITFDSDAKPGKQEKEVTLFTNDPRNPKVEFIIQADVKAKRK